MPTIRAVVFDAFGTLLDTVSATRRHAARLGDGWEAFSTLWRTKQFEYSWVRSLAGAAQHRDFARIVDDALAHAAATHHVEDVALLAELRDGFDRLDVFPDVHPALAALRAAGLSRAILSNGTPSMLAHQVRAAKLGDLLDHVLSVEAVGVYKPDARVYHLAVDTLGMSAEHVAFVSSNPWDAFGAHAFGMRTFRINRAGDPDEYGLRGRVTEIADLAELPAPAGLTPAARIAAAIELLAAIDGAPRKPADAVANDFFRQRRYIGSGDRRAVSDRGWRVLRERRRLSWWLERVQLRPGPRLLVAASLLTEGWTLAGVVQSFSGGQYGPLAVGRG